MNAGKSLDAGAAEIAGACLNYLSADPAQLADFMAAAGLDPDGLRAGVANGSLAAGLLDYFAHNEAALTAMCANARLPVEAVMRAYYRLNPDG